MEMYVVELGNVTADGFKRVEKQNVLASDFEAGKLRAVDVLKTRGVQVGCRRLQMLDGAGKMIWEYP
jgi:hypothetical protein